MIVAQSLEIKNMSKLIIFSRLSQACAETVIATAVINALFES
jgi:hypothetical protein